MQAKKYPFAVRLIGFEGTEGAQISAMLTLAPSLGPAYFCLLEDSLQEPDLYIANGSDVRSLAALAAANPSARQPALIVGAAAVDLPYEHIERPLDPGRLFVLLQRMVDQRADEIAKITARGLPDVPERRRRRRPDFDLTDPSDYLKMRKTPPGGAVLIVDRGPSCRDHVARLLAPRKVEVEWTDSASAAIRLCDETPVSVVLVNTSTPEVDPYALCASIKGLAGAARIAVVFLVGSDFHYDPARARAVGVRGLLDKPIADRHLSATIKRLLSLPL
ncbi:response regulator [Zemynaea arenosa]|nr:response regulator [Massilia arenosa]